jgi:hypothetical protein
MDRVSEILYLYEDDVESFADGGRIGLRRGSKPLYQNVEGQPHIKRHPVSKKYLVTRSVMRDGKTTSQYKGGIDDLDEAITVRDTFVKDLPVETTAATNIRTKKGKGKLDTKELQKASKFFYKRGEISSPNYLDLKEAELKKVYDNVSGGATPGKFSKTTIFDPLKKSAQNKILKQFPDANFELYKYGFSSQADKQTFDAVNDFVERGYKPAFHNIKNLPKKTQDIIIEAFGKEATDAGIELKFGPGRKFGITPKENKQVYTMIQNFIQNTGKEHPYAFSFEKPENWIIAQMARASKNNPDVYKVLKNDAGKIIGASENGVKYYHANSKIGNAITNHPEAKKISKFVSVAKNAKASIPQSLMKMFPKGFDTNLLRGDRAYNDLLQWLDNSKGRRITANAINVHHAGAGGVGGNPSLAKDLQLLTRQDNITAEVIKNQILNNDFSRVQELKDKGIRLNVGGKEYGAGFETAKKGLKRIETQSAATLSERLKADPELKGFKKFLEQTLTPKHQQLIKRQFCPGNKDGLTAGTCPIEEAMDNMIKQTNDVKRGAVKGAEAARIANKASKVARFGTGAGLAKVLGPYGLAAEALFEVAMAVPGYARGESGKRLLGDSLLGLIPGVGQSAEEEFDEYATKAGMSELEQQKIKDANRFLELNDALPLAYKNIGKGGRGDPLKGAKNFERLYNEYSPLYDQFVGGPPSESVSTVLAEQDRINQQIAEDKAERAEKRNIAGEEDFMAAGGGIAGIRRPGAIPPESGPQPQGLENLKYYVTNT